MRHANDKGRLARKTPWAAYQESGWSAAYGSESRGGIKGEHRGTLKATVHPTSRQLEWAAGFLEGEGHFERTKSSGSYLVSASQKEREPLEKLLALFGGQIGVLQRGKWGTYWQWRVCGARARGVMMTVFVLMSRRRKDQIKTAFQIAA